MTSAFIAGLLLGILVSAGMSIACDKAAEREKIWNSADGRRVYHLTPIDEETTIKENHDDQDHERQQTH
jgi:hypothetical protein